MSNGIKFSVGLIIVILLLNGCTTVKNNQSNQTLYLQLEAYIDSKIIRDGVLGTVDIGAYDSWLNQHRSIDELY
ncbi:hypothetical protein CODIS_10250 [Candidatus Thiodiazotropha endolucinida]|uniref:Uncharacterized protein n=1 Tax=Candidatus Thiodiazotropha endolucinida TaxID=1655433 RepID=A0A7Z0VPE1_9GAMM|nr:hypothetical protein CODIS_10250 [Candidatus Thiodiazotropha endolucinida]